MKKFFVLLIRTKFRKEKQVKILTVDFPEVDTQNIFQVFGSFHEKVVYYESRKREVKIRLMNEGRCDERLKARVEESTCLTYTGLHDKTN
jgi:hypothetical protein